MRMKNKILILLIDEIRLCTNIWIMCFPLAYFCKLIYLAYVHKGNKWNRICKDSICNNPKLVLGSNVNGPNNKFVERGCQRTRLTLKEKRLNLTFIDELALI